MNKYKKGTFGHALEQLEAIEGIEVFQNGNAMMAVSGVYQGRILTSSSNGMNGRSYGWFNNDLIKNNEHDTKIAFLGGESRLWFGPEYGAFSLCFEKGAEQIDANMFRPKALHQQKFKEVARTEHSLTVSGQMEMKNASDFGFKLGVERTITLLSKEEIEETLEISTTQLNFIGFSAENTIRNISTEPFKKETGLIAVWELGCMLTSPDTQIIIPLSQSTDNVVEYFGEIGERLKIKDNVVFYNADAQSMGKIGIPPAFCRNVMGSYSRADNQLNIVTFTFEHEELYVNSVPKNTAPYKGDVINIFNGEVNPEKEWNLPFYEFESSSSAKELQPNEQLYHKQTTYHFEGEFETLNKIAKTVLGVDLNDISE